MRRYLMFLLPLLLIGCATTRTHFESIPLEESAFKMQPVDLRGKYPDINKHDGPHAHGFFGTVFDMPPMQELEKSWNKPDSKRPSWWNVWRGVTTIGVGLAISAPPALIAGVTTYVLAVHPTSVWEWDKGDYKVSCVVDYAAALKYEPHLVYWRWYYKKDDENRIKAEKEAAIGPHGESLSEAEINIMNAELPPLISE